MDVVDLKKLDEELQNHLNNVWRKQKNDKPKVRIAASARGGEKEEEEEWEIDPDKLLVKSVMIGKGSFGSVHRGLYNGKDVAVKVLEYCGEEGQRTEANVASLRKAFMQEVSVWHKLEHPNVTKLIGAARGTSELRFETDNGQATMPSNFCCIVVEYLRGGTLKNYLIKHWRNKLPFDAVMGLALDIARGLSHLHAHKIVHRDIKTENMLLDEKRTVKISDFGVARLMASNLDEMTGQTGTLGYMAPEVFNSEPYDHKCDVYSYGICLWEIYCCDMPYPNLSFSEQTSAVVYKNLRPEIPRCCPKSLGKVMRQCWDADPKKRPEMKEVVAMLEAIDISKGGGMAPLDQPQGCFSCCFRPSRS